MEKYKETLEITISSFAMKGDKERIISASFYNYGSKPIKVLEFRKLVLSSLHESYTSKCSSLDLEAIQKHNKYIGKRIKRGLFQGLNYLLNADVNGVLNILRKVVRDGFIQDLSDRGCWFQPMRIRDIFQTSHEKFLLKSCYLF